MTRPLLVIDGDSLAHRAYHALPKTFRRAEGRPGNALLGFSNFLVRLWDGEQPRAVLVGWDSLDSPTYRHELFAGYQGGPEEVRERYGVEPAQVPDFIALRGDPSDRLPGAKGVGPKTAADILREYGSLEAALEAGRFAAQADELRVYKRMATLDAAAPLPMLDDQTPAWSDASEFVRELGLNALADRLAVLAST